MSCVCKYSCRIGFCALVCENKMNKVMLFTIQ